MPAGMFFFSPAPVVFASCQCVLGPAEYFTIRKENYKVLETKLSYCKAQTQANKRVQGICSNSLNLRY